MEIWDQLCRLLRARVVSVEDVSNKVHALPACRSDSLHPAGGESTQHSAHEGVIHVRL